MSRDYVCTDLFVFKVCFLTCFDMPTSSATHFFGAIEFWRLQLLHAYTSCTKSHALCCWQMSRSTVVQTGDT